MSRRPTGERAMTDAERQRKRRERLGIGGEWLPARRPWDDQRSGNRKETQTIEEIEWWLENGDKDAVTKWLVFHLEARGDHAALLEDVRRRIDELEVEANRDTSSVTDTEEH